MEQIIPAPDPLRTAVLTPAQPNNITHVADPSVLKKKKSVLFRGDGLWVANSAY